jgi:hypothetical protein
MDTNNPAGRDPMEVVQELAEGKIHCACGNDDWHMFLFVGAPTPAMAGCKKCARVHILKDGAWVEKTGPAPGP